jgi:hypothetical protein
VAGTSKEFGLEGGIRRRVGRYLYTVFALATASLRAGQSLDQAVYLAVGLIHTAHWCFSRSSCTGHRFVTCPNPVQKRHLWACSYYVSVAVAVNVLRILAIAKKGLVVVDLAALQ